MSLNSPNRTQRSGKGRDQSTWTKSPRPGTSTMSSTLAAASSGLLGRNRTTIGSPKTSVLLLKQNHATFEAPSQKVSVFFDECNKEIISLTSGIPNSTGGSGGLRTRVVFQATDCCKHRDRVEFLLPIEKRILSIKFNPDRSVLAYHVEKSNVEFVNVSCLISDDGIVSYKLSDKKYIQSSKTKNSKLFGFLWIGTMQLVMITDISIEYYSVDALRGRLKHLKTFQSSTNWFVYQPSNLQVEGDPDDTETSEADSYSILMISTGSFGNSMQPYMFNRGRMVKLQRFDVEGNWNAGEKVELFERSITIGSIYNKVRLMVLQHESLNIKSKGAQILVYTIDTETGLTSKTHTLDLDISGRFAINIFDNMIIAHDQPSKSSFIFDLMIESTEKSDCSKQYVSLIDGQPIKPFCLEGEKENIEMYSLNWVFFQPNFIIDAKKGLLSTLYIDLAGMPEVIQDNILLLNFLAHRKNSEQIILKKCRAIVENSLRASKHESYLHSSPLADVSSIFDILSKLVISAPELEKKPSNVDKNIVTPSRIGQQACVYSAAIHQEDLHREVFKQLEYINPKVMLS